MRFASLTFVAIALAAAATTGVARAEDEPNVIAARDAFADGERKFEAGDYVRALASFERAFALVPHDAIRFNIAVCMERLQRRADAMTQYLRASEAPSLKEEERRRARAAADRIRPELGTLAVEGDPAARVALSVDGEVRCNVPCRVELDPGSHRISWARAADREERIVRVERGQTLSLAIATHEIAPPPVSPAPVVVAPIAPVTPAPTAPPERPRAPTWLTWTGVGVSTVGAVGIVGFGLRTESLHDDYVTAPTRDTYDAGVLSRTLTNVSIGVVIAGAALVAVDLLARR